MFSPAYIKFLTQDEPSQKKPKATQIYPIIIPPVEESPCPRLVPFLRRGRIAFTPCCLPPDMFDKGKEVDADWADSGNSSSGERERPDEGDEEKPLKPQVGYINGLCCRQRHYMFPSFCRSFRGLRGPYRLSEPLGRRARRG